MEIKKYASHVVIPRVKTMKYPGAWHLLLVHFINNAKYQKQCDSSHFNFLSFCFDSVEC